MRQASWEELFRKDETVREEKPSVWQKIAVYFWWEELVTLLILFIAFLIVVQSINSAHWVPEMPNLFTVAYLGLGIGLILARTRLPEYLAHPLALAVGTVGVIYSVTGKMEGTFSERLSELVERMQLWSEAFFSGGISNDNLPFVVLVVSLTYLATYIAAWSLFRWYNPWLGLIPGGLALLTNLSYLPGQESFPLILYLFCAILLVSRVNLLRNEREWRRQGTEYPEFISLQVLNITVWVSLALLLSAWIAPIGSGSGLLYSLWMKVTSPLVEPLGDFGRVFTAIDAKRGGAVHGFGSALPLQGAISLTGSEVMQVTAAEPGFLRAQSYDQYSAAGWKVNNSQITAGAWPALKALQSPEEARRQLRRPVSIQVNTLKRMSVIVSSGDPLAVSIDSRVVFGPDQTDVTSIRPTSRLRQGTQYRVDSTVSNASVQRLQTATTSYNAWVTTYLQLPSDFSRLVTRKALEVTAGATSAYDKATQIESYLRGFTVDTQIKAAPANRDSVEYFLFETGKGYFDYHASAMVVMLRSVGVPARLAVGYVIRPQDRVPDTDIYMVTEANAFAWAEVYFPGFGWVEFNPTPSEPKVQRLGSDDEILSGEEEELLDEEDILPTGDVEPAPEALDELQAEEGSSLISRIILTIVLLFLGITVIGGGIFQYSWQHGLGGLPYSMQVWEKTLRLARWVKIRPQPQETPRDLVGRLRRELPEVEDLDYLGESFIRTRYGAKDLGPEEKERLMTVWNQVRNTLLGRLLRFK